MNGPWLVLDTATPIAAVGVWRDGEALAEHLLTETRRHAEGLIDAIDRALLLADVPLEDVVGLGVGRGPGSFIGVRTGIATAKGIALGRGVPLVGLPTLVALARSVTLPDGRGVAVVDAKRGEVYVQLVEARAGDVRALEPAFACAPADAARAAAGLAFAVGAGDAVASLAGVVSLVTAAGPSVAGLGRALAARLADDGRLDELATLVPDYCRAPDAKLPAVDPSARRTLAGG